MHAVVFSHGATNVFDDMQRFSGMDISFFIKLWSRKASLQDKYVHGSIPDYSKWRNSTLEKLIGAGLNQGGHTNLDGIDYRTSGLAADILVMKSNLNEIQNLFRFCRENNIMPEIKTYIPEGPTRIAQAHNLQVYTTKQLLQLRSDEVTNEDFNELRRKLIEIDTKEFGIVAMNTFYPQAVKCTQSMGSLYVTVTGDILSCVGTHFSYGVYQPGKDMLKKVIRERIEKVGFGCVPRIQEARERNLTIARDLLDVYSEGMR